MFSGCEEACEDRERHIPDHIFRVLIISQVEYSSLVCLEEKHAKTHRHKQFILFLL